MVWQLVILGWLGSLPKKFKSYFFTKKYIFFKFHYRAEAEEHAYKTQVDLISYIESTILGDPFNFLSNWPTYVWLNLIPTCSLVGSGRLYRVPRLRTLYHKITRAKGIMLFQGTNQNHPNGYRISFMPNQVWIFFFMTQAIQLGSKNHIFFKN